MELKILGSRNDPPRSRMPIRISSPTKGVKRQFFYDTPVSGLVGTSGFISVEGILPVQPPSPIKKRPVARGSADKPTSTPSRLSKKARGIDEQAQREKYAADLFVQLNSTVFDDLLPKETELEWNKRLLTTAGRARWHRWAFYDTILSPLIDMRWQLTRWRGQHQSGVVCQDFGL